MVLSNLHIAWVSRTCRPLIGSTRANGVICEFWQMAAAGRAFSSSRWRANNYGVKTEISKDLHARTRR